MNPYRKRRIQLFESLVSRLNAEPIRILDVGGEMAFWKDTEFWDNPKYQITVSNIGREEEERAYLAQHGPSNIDWLYADATDLGPALERGYDALFSNSVIEHVGGWAEMARMAAWFEGFDGPYFVQTPNLWFPIEPHFRTPFFGLLPYGVRVLLVRCFHLGCYRRARTWAEARAKVDTTRLLTAGEMRRLFPKATLVREKVYGLTKSIYAHTFPDR
ncbi:MAG: class I SAM-dependent methyltransferase [Candidatus Hydrogenedentes bacterium]|nr:class I SAM-dependent methyltransferase [Candidatus Hydrogenedentota bacterium]